MGRLAAFIHRLRVLFKRAEADRAMDEEVAHHLDLETERNIRLGMSQADARRQALVAFGGVEQVREAHREVRNTRWLEELRGDTRYALRTLRRAPVFAIAAILTLGLGIGANTAIFSAVSAVILKPLPFPGSDRLVMLWEENAVKGWHQNVVAPANFLDWKEQVPAFENTAAWVPSLTPVALTEAGEPKRLLVSSVTGNLFATLGVPAELGRTFRDEETWDNGSHVIMLSHRVWRDQFGADPGIIGRSIHLGGVTAQVVGVMPDGFTFPKEGVDAWSPVGWDPADRAQVWFRRAHWPRAVARLKPGISREQADAQFQLVVQRLSQQFPVTNTGMGAGMTPLHEFLIGDTRLPLLVLLGSVALLLLIACANVGNLLLVRAAGREREVALRLAIGAGRMRLVRQALTESLVLSLLGGIVGLGLGWWGTRMLIRLEPEDMLRVKDFGVDGQVLLYVVLVTTVSGLLFGIAPALWTARRAPAEALREGGRAGSGSRRLHRWGNALVVGEVALALLLTIGSGLLVRSFWRLSAVDPGINPAGVLGVEIDLPTNAGGLYDSDSKAAGFFTTAVERLHALPSVTGVALVSALPLSGGQWSSDFTAQGWPAEKFGSEVLHRTASPEYLRVMGVRLLAGRWIDRTDGPNSPRVVVVNEALARQFFAGLDPVGQRIAFDRVPDSTSVWRTIVGVVSDEHQRQLSVSPQIEIFAPSEQDQSSSGTLLIRTTGDPASLGPTVRRALAGIDPDLMPPTIRTMTDVVRESMARERFLTILLGLFSIVGFLLAMVGVYGVLAQLALHRVREMGIRLALGANPWQVQLLVLRNGLVLLGAGLAGGTVAALFATRLLKGLLFETPPADPVTFGVVGVTLLMTGILASWLPALQASRADPTQTLRAE